MPKHNLPFRLAEIALIFALFAVQGAWPVPDVNEPYYLGKAIHYWNRSWGAGDFFLESADTHAIFYFTFGWLSLWLAPAALAWTGRAVTWALLAWSWERLSWAIVPRRWYAVLSAGLFACLMERCHMAGEWVIGGVEAKGFAYVLVFLGLESLVRGRWNRAWIAFGAYGTSCCVRRSAILSQRCRQALPITFGRLLKSLRLSPDELVYNHDPE